MSHNKTKGTLVSVRMPSDLQVVLLQGNELPIYEIFLTLAGLSLSTAATFWTSYMTLEPRNGSLLFSAVAFSLLTVLSLGAALFLRSRVFQKQVTIKTSLENFKK
jgi:hypothetical protein